jgi:hypothetical protein
MKWLQIVLKYMPVVISAVKSVEDTVGSEVPGTAKKQIVLDVISAAAKAGETIPDADVAAISMLVDIVVGSLNATGVFKKSAPTA